MKILLTGGGSRGHTQPVVAVAAALRASYPDVELLFVGVKLALEKPIAERANIPYKNLPYDFRCRRFLSLDNIKSLFSLRGAKREARKILDDFRPDVVFAKGGYGSYPIGVEASKRGIPLVLHESDITLGLANKILVKRAKTICTSFEGVYKNEVVTGNPIREEILHGDTAKAREFFKFLNDKPVIFATAATSAAENFSRSVIGAAKSLDKYNFILQYGLADPQLVEKWSQGIDNLRVVKNLATEMADAYAVADLLISRASASSIFEIAILAKPAILLPLPKTVSRGDQLLNAQYFLERSAARVIQNEGLTADSLKAEIEDLMNNPDKAASLKTAVAKLAPRDAANKVAEEVLKVV